MSLKLKMTIPLLLMLVCPLIIAFSAYAADPSSNIQLEVPSQIQFKLNAQGQLVSPSSSVMTMKNKSSFEVRVASVKFTPSENWNVVSNAYESSLPNSVSISIGPSANKMSMASCSNASKDVDNELAWTMSSETANIDLAKIDLEAEGAATNVTTRGSGESVGTASWYLASDTTTNEIQNRLTVLEEENEQLRAELGEKAPKDEAVKNISRSGNTFTATRTDNTTFTFDQKDDNTVTSVKGDAESSYRTGQVNLTPANIGAATAGHTHNYAGSSSAGGVANSSYHPYFTHANEINFGPKFTSNNTIYFGYRWADDTQAAYILGYRFCNGNGDNLAPIYASNIRYTSTVLYNNTTGTNGTVTLSASAANYNHMRIYYYRKDESNAYGDTVIFSPNGKRASLLIANASNSSVMQLNMASVTISGTQITRYNKEGYMNVGTSSAGVISNNCIYITRVEAWNE